MPPAEAEPAPSNPAPVITSANNLNIDPESTDWEDGQEGVIEVHVRQDAPGKFTVLEVLSAESTEAAPPDESDEAKVTPRNTSAPIANKGVTNPAVAGLIGKNR